MQLSKLSQMFILQYHDESFKTFLASKFAQFLYVITFILSSKFYKNWLLIIMKCIRRASNFSSEFCNNNSNCIWQIHQANASPFLSNGKWLLRQLKKRNLLFIFLGSDCCIVLIEIYLWFSINMNNSIINLLIYLKYIFYRSLGYDIIKQA